ncbi:hypothetical protein CAPTEDRAFT_159933 [Capitella teleta]|uniref:FAM50A/XAP5 C-terminal domain-containing protein n=1 Tax=Capitella teleta TaxID=283909 RepID=R7TLE3_CAPTE|nr:hypothetical protein CAPTEDRAFT_159933 [Capitella teleta]|eukprot:ELT94668.1 hypothetical protein CAPTEDRAFT_159933 [Capitella teleta]
MAHYGGQAKDSSRAAILMKKREIELEDLEVKKRKIEEEMKVDNINNKFAAHYDAIEQRLKSNTVGLVTLDQMREKQKDIVRLREQQMAVNTADAHLPVDSSRHQNSKSKRKPKAVLSFSMDDDEEEEEEEVVVKKKEVEVKIKIKKETEEEDEEEKKTKENERRKRFGKNPDVDTSFLPDRDREEEDARLREELRAEWEAKQEKIKNEEIDITYSYWDGSGHRRNIRMRKGNSIHQFLQKCLESLRKEFSELRSASVDHLMYIKEDLIIPQHNTFYDFIVTKARGKSGPLFSFDVHEDVRMISDARVEKDESHAGKVCLRSWYERHKHIFPASRWEPYDPEKNYEKYTISDKESAKITVK